MLIMKLKRIVKYLFVPIFIGVLVFLFIFSNQRNTQKIIKKIDTNGLDNIGRYWKYGTYNLKTKICQFGKKEY
mgnify:CR=1 FL=1